MAEEHAGFCRIREEYCIALYDIVCNCWFLNSIVIVPACACTVIKFYSDCTCTPAHF